MTDYAAKIMGGALAEAVRAAVAAERARREAAEAECARLRVNLEATERARQAAEEERDAVLELVADDVVRAAQERDERDARRLAALVVAQVALADAEADRDYWREQATAAAPCVDEIRRLARRVVRGGTGCALDPVLAVDTAIATLDGMMVPIERIASDRDTARAETDALRVALADNDLILEERERQLTAALTAIEEERARCAAVCREVASRYRRGACGCEECEGRSDGARECAEAIEREAVLKPLDIQPFAEKLARAAFGRCVYLRPELVLALSAGH
ncbi:hypothetical protein [Streptococcus uberis]